MAGNGDTPGIEPEDEELETPGYKPPEKKSLQEIQQADADDESLQRYKKQLLGDLPADDDGDPRNVIVKKMAICPSDRDDIVLDLTGDISKLKNSPITMKEGCEYKIRIIFEVKKEIVSGLRLHQSTFKMGVKVNTDQLMVGSYGPKKEEQQFETKPDEAPKGMMHRGSYKMKSKFLDDDKNVYLAWEWTMEIKKDWD